MKKYILIPAILTIPFMAQAESPEVGSNPYSKLYEMEIKVKPNLNMCADVNQKCFFDDLLVLGTVNGEPNKSVGVIYPSVDDPNKGEIQFDYGKVKEGDTFSIHSKTGGKTHKFVCPNFPYTTQHTIQNGKSITVTCDRK